MEEFNDTLNPENTAYSTFPARSDGSVRPYSMDKVTALALSANLLFVGTEKGVVTQYMVEEQETDCTCFMYTELMARYISDSPISKIGCCLSINLLVILNDQVLTLCDAEQLERSGFNLPCREVITFNLCTWEAASAKLSLAFASKRIGIYLLTENTAELIFETSLNSVPKSLCLTTNFLGVVVSNQYLSVNLRTKTVIELLQFDPASVRSFITVVEKDVFFIAGPGSLGVVVAATGTSQHNPIQMSPNILDVFVWKDYIYAVTDEFFTIHSLQNQTQVQTVLISNATAACFTPDSMHFVFVSTWCPHSSKTDLVAVGPERWDKFARQLILAGCLNEARQLVIKHKRHMSALVEQRPASSKNEQNVYLKRSRRVFGLLGFYYFEQGVFTSAQTFFEKAVIDIRELLYRYEDLLPRGYAFQPDPFYQLIVTDQDGTEMSARSVTDLCLLHALREANGRAMSTGDANPNPDVTSQWAARYDQFLFDFLQKHHKSRFTEFACHFLETALVKLYLKLSKHGIRPTLNELILPIDRLETSQLRMLSYDPHDTNRNAAHDLIQLISSLIHIDVDDLVIFLRHAEAHHALALIYQWQGNLSAALDVWQRLAYGELKDKYFPGDEFYLAVLHSLTVPDKEGQIEHQTVAHSDLASVNTSDHFVPSAYTELVWQHLCRALDANKFELCEKILSGIPVPPKYGDSPSWIRPSSQTQTHPESTDQFWISATVATDTAVNSDPMLAPSQLLMPENILNRILPRHPELTRKYLHQLIYKHGDCNPSHHNTLAELYLDSVQKALDKVELSDLERKDQLRLRREFCHFLRHSEHYSVDRLLKRMHLLGYQTLPFEAAILLGKSRQHRAALQILVIDLNHISAAICYCLSFSRACPRTADSASLAAAQKLTTLGSSLCCHAPINDASEAEAFTALVELCMNSDKSSHKQLAVDLINLPDIPFDFVRILRFLPPQLSICQIKPFLTRALRATQHTHCTVQLSLGLAKRQAILSAEAVYSDKTTAQLPRLERSGIEQCASCRQPLTLYGPTSAVAWSSLTDQCFHVHCWEQFHRTV